LQFSFRPLRWSDALAVSRWSYTGEYAFYDMTRWQMFTTRLFNPLFRAIGLASFYAVDVVGAQDSADAKDRADSALVGVFSYIRRDIETVEIGLAMRPDLTGHGLGAAYVEAGMAFGRTRYHPKRWFLTVATFNRRAQLVYERAGFVVEGMTTQRSHGREVEYLQMARPAN